MRRGFGFLWVALTSILLVIVGLAWPWISKLPWGRLPGDISIERENFSFHFPLMTCLIEWHSPH